MKLLIKNVLSAMVVLMANAALAATPDCPTCDSWVPASPCNYVNSSRPNSYPIQYVIIHKVQGSAASAVAWFQNCVADQSAHYAINNNTGYCYQSVLEEDIALHVDSWYLNSHSIGIYHGGYSTTNDTTAACYDQSALITKSAIIYYDVLYDQNHITGHSPTCPGPNWNWQYYMAQCNPFTAVASLIDDTPECSKNWGTGIGKCQYGPNFRWHSTGPYNDPATWTVNITVAGYYDISAIWCSGANRSPNAPYILPGGGVVSKNQQVNGGQWNLLGSKYLAVGPQTVTLSCWTAAGYIVIADAVKFSGPN